MINGVYISKDTNQPYDGPVFSIYETGEIKNDGFFKDGRPDGITRSWYKNKKIKSELRFKNGKNDGLQTFWYDNGSKREEGTYNDGLRDGDKVEFRLVEGDRGLKAVDISPV